CHSDNGVASETSLEFPREGASDEQIALFGLSLVDYVDRDKPDESLLLLKPTKRIKHTGGERIKAGSDEEKSLRAWVTYLAGLSDQQVVQARKRIASSQRS